VFVHEGGSSKEMTWTSTSPIFRQTRTRGGFPALHRLSKVSAATLLSICPHRQLALIILSSLAVDGPHKSLRFLFFEIDASLWCSLDTRQEASPSRGLNEDFGVLATGI